MADFWETSKGMILDKWLEEVKKVHRPDFDNDAKKYKVTKQYITLLRQHPASS